MKARVMKHTVFVLMLNPEEIWSSEVIEPADHW